MNNAAAIAALLTVKEQRRLLGAEKILHAVTGRSRAAATAHDALQSKIIFKHEGSLKAVR